MLLSGNTALNQLTQSRSYELQIRMTDHESWEAFAQYSYFSVGAVNTNYQLTVTGYSGTAGMYSSKHDTFTQCWYNAGPASQTVI